MLLVWMTKDEGHAYNFHSCIEIPPPTLPTAGSEQTSIAIERSTI